VEIFKVGNLSKDLRSDSFAGNSKRKGVESFSAPFKIF